jgi:hypothetical protein
MRFGESAIGVGAADMRRDRHDAPDPGGAGIGENLRHPAGKGGKVEVTMAVDEHGAKEPRTLIRPL